MATTADISRDANLILAAIKSGVPKADVRVLQRRYAKLTREYEAAACAEWAAAPMGPGL